MIELGALYIAACAQSRCVVLSLDNIMAKAILALTLSRHVIDELGGICNRAHALIADELQIGWFIHQPANKRGIIDVDLAKPEAFRFKNNHTIR